MFHTMSTLHRGTFPSQARRRKRRSTSVLSPKKILRLTIVLTMSFLCWIGVGCFAFEMVQLAGR
jgi:hypothetical protein